MIKMLAMVGILIGILMVGTNVNHWDTLNRACAKIDLDTESLGDWTPIIPPICWITGRFADIGLDFGEWLYPHHQTFLLVMLGLSMLGFALPGIVTTIFIIYFIIKHRREFLRRRKLA